MEKVLIRVAEKLLDEKTNTRMCKYVFAATALFIAAQVIKTILN